MAPEKDQEEHNREVQKLCFEYFKHFTTVATAAALVELVLYQRLNLGSAAAIVGVSMLGLTLLLAVGGMLLVPTQAGVQGEFPRVRTSFMVLLSGVASVFFFGILLFAIVAINPDLSRVLNLVLSIGGPVISVISALLGYLGYHYYRLSRAYKELSYEVVSSPLHRANELTKDEFQVTYQGQVVVTNVDDVTIIIRNTGTEAVVFDDVSPSVETPITIDFGQTARIMKVSLETSPEDVTAEYLIDVEDTSSRIILRRFSLNPGDSIDIHTVLTNFSEEDLTIDWRLQGVAPP